MTQDRSTTSEGAPDASDIVDGPVGDAWLKDPSAPGPTGADLGGLSSIDVPPRDRTDEDGSIVGVPGPQERQGQEHVAVD